MRYSAAKERDMPLFRTLQWSWFVVAIFYTYGDFLHEFVLKHRALLWLSHITMFNAWLSFIAYCCVFVVSVLTLKKGLYKYQVHKRENRLRKEKEVLHILPQGLGGRGRRSFPGGRVAVFSTSLPLPLPLVGLVS